jgi:hypothetical protein
LEITFGEGQFGWEHPLQVFLHGIRGTGEDLFFVPKCNRSRVSDAGPNAENRPITFRKEFNIPGCLRSRSYDAHVALEDVPELRDLIDFRLSQNPSDAGNPAIAGHRNIRSGSIGSHGSEFQDSKPAKSATHPLLGIEHRPSGADDDKNRNQREQWARYQKYCATESDIKAAFKQQRFVLQT